MLTLPAFAKINWNLRVLGKRPDGYHEICTTFQTISLCDFLTFELSDELSLSCNALDIPTDKQNLVVRAAHLLRERFFIKAGVKIHLQKKIPSPGGLGGGSANAAVTLLALTNLWNIKISERELVEIGKTLGADVPFFLFGGTALGTGLGTEIEPLTDVPRTLLLIVTPDEYVSTAEAYNALAAPLLTELGSSAIFTICRFESGNANFAQTHLQNDFEKTIFRLKPEIARVKTQLFETGARNALMSGSGASIFGIFDNEATRSAAFNLLSAKEKSWRVFLCETVSRGEYKRALLPCFDLLT